MGPFFASARQGTESLEAQGFLEETRARLEATMPVDASRDFYMDGSLDEPPVLPTVEEVPGRPPRTFEQWAEAHAEDFR